MAEKAKLLLFVGGSVASYRCVDFIRKLLEEYDVDVLLSNGAKNFVTTTSIESFLNKKVLSNDPFHSSYLGPDHIALARKASVILGYGVTANTLAKMKAGLCEDMFLLQYMAFKGKVVLAPAMNPAMWEHPATRENVKTLKLRGVDFVGPSDNIVACGEKGVGHIASDDQILLNLKTEKATEQSAEKAFPKNLLGKKILISAGPMRSKLDSVRFMQNSSSGTTGLEIAREAKKRGAIVEVLLGPVDTTIQRSFVTEFEVFEYENSKDYGTLLNARFSNSDLFLSAAAVLDFETIPLEGKITKEDVGSELSVSVRPVPDFVQQVAEAKKDYQKVVAFALQSGSQAEQEAKARAKLFAKKCDAIVWNTVSDSEGPGFEKSHFRLLSKGKKDFSDLGLHPKGKLAASLWDELEAILWPGLVRTQGSSAVSDFTPTA